MSASGPVSGAGSSGPAPSGWDRLPGPVAFLAGPTAVGKSSVALALAKRHGWGLLSLDSRQVYRRLDRGTAKPSARERRTVPHFLLDLLEPSELCSAVRFQGFYLEALAEAAALRLPLLAVGGAGFYWDVCTRGLQELPATPPELRRETDAILEAEGVTGLRRRLQQLDPDAARRLSPNDRQRLGRALELVRLTGRPTAELYAERDAALERDSRLPRAPVVVLLRERADLYARIEQRCHAMLAEGLLDEIRELLEGGLDPRAPGLRTVGYREFLPHLIEGKDLESAVERFKRNSRRYGKRQETWFRNRVPERHDVRIEPGQDTDSLVRRVEAILGRTPAS